MNVFMADNEVNRRHTEISPSHPYRSLLNEVDYRDLIPYQQFRGSLEEVFSRTIDAIEEPVGLENKASLLFHPPRIIRALVDYKIANPNFDINNIIEAITICKIIYQRRADPKAIAAFYSRLIGQNEQLRGLNIIQELDTPALQAIQPYHAESTVAKIKQNVNNVDIFVIALAHGGVIGGIDNYLRYCDQVDSQNSGLYVVRYSRGKKHDSEPQLNEAERLYITEASKGKPIVILDEDAATGRTLLSAKSFFRDELKFPSVFSFANLDCRDILQSTGLDLADTTPRCTPLFQNSAQIEQAAGLTLEEEYAQFGQASELRIKKIFAFFLEGLSR